jgi:hypothetical protein
MLRHARSARLVDGADEVRGARSEAKSETEPESAKGRAGLGRAAE